MRFYIRELVLTGGLAKEPPTFPGTVIGFRSMWTEAGIEISLCGREQRKFPPRYEFDRSDLGGLCSILGFQGVA